MARISDLLVASIMATAFDAHLDQPGEEVIEGQGGWWGSAEQLAGMDQLGGAARVIFMETTEGNLESDPDQFMATAVDILERRFPKYMPQQWSSGVNYALHVEALEVGSPLEGRPPHPELPLDLYDQLHRLGVRSFTPSYHKHNPFGGCSKESGTGIHTFGDQMVQHLMGTLGWKLCMAHMSEACMHDTIVRCTSLGVNNRLSYTHGGIRWDNPSPLFSGNEERMISFDTVKVVIERGGLVGISPAMPFYDGPERYFADLLRLIDINRGEGVAIGTDAGGLLDEWLFPGWKSVEVMFRQTIIGLLERGVPEHIVRKVIGQNARNFFMR